MTTHRGMAAGRFDASADPLFRQINDSLPFDWRLVQHDITGSAAWARALGRVGVLKADEVTRLENALAELSREAAQTPTPPLASGAEDVHTWVESRLTAMLGDLGKRLHTGRSRNDQVATDVRLWTREAIDERLAEVRALQGELLALARRQERTVFPGYTHLQRAQPILFAHWCLAYFDMLDRDAARFADARRRVNVCPLGSGALAGTAYAVDRAALAADLGFDAATANSLDAVGDRDAVLETLHAAGVCAVHLSRLAEECILYTTGEFAYFRMEDAVTSGSSLMPQKKNPDAMELVRGKCGRILAAGSALAVALKGTPLAYNKDMQEDKEPLFDAMDALSLCLRATARVLRGLEVDAPAAERAARAGHSNATDLADFLVSRGVPFRDAHHQAGAVVREALARGQNIEDLPLDVLRRHAPACDVRVYAALTLESVLARRAAAGGTAPQRVAEALDAAEGRLRRAAGAGGSSGGAAGA